MTHMPDGHTRSPGQPPGAAPFRQGAGGAGKHLAGGALVLALLAPLACCGLPLLVLAGAAIGWAAVGWIGGGIAAAAVAAAVLWLRRRRAQECCPPAQRAREPW